MATLPSIRPSLTSSKSVKARILKNEFGDGYSQRAADGLNNTPASWTLIWGGRTKADIDTLEAFFEGLGGWDTIEWTPEHESTEKKFICTEWSRSFYDNDENDTLTAKLEQVYDL